MSIRYMSDAIPCKFFGSYLPKPLDHVDNPSFYLLRPHFGGPLIFGFGHGRTLALAVKNNRTDSRSSELLSRLSTMAAVGANWRPSVLRSQSRMRASISACSTISLATRGFRWPDCWIMRASAALPGWNCNDTSKRSF